MVDTFRFDAARPICDRLFGGEEVRSLGVETMPNFRALLPLGQSEEAELLEVAYLAASAAFEAARKCQDWSSTDGHLGQHRGDLVADEAALKVLESSGLGIYSEESGVNDKDKDLIAVIDPVDGSANVARNIPFWCSSIAVVDKAGPLISLLVGAPDGAVYFAVREGGAYKGGLRLKPRPAKPLGESVLFVNGFPKSHLGWMQYRTLGSAALELCLVAAGSAEGFVDVSPRGLGLWDYLGAALLLGELGYVFGDTENREVYWIEHEERRHIVAARDQGLYDAIVSKVSGLKRSSTKREG